MGCETSTPGCSPSPLAGEGLSRVAELAADEAGAPVAIVPAPRASPRIIEPTLSR